MMWGIYRRNARESGNAVGIYRRNAEEGGMMWEYPEGMLRNAE